MDDNVPELAPEGVPDTEVTAAPETVETETPVEQQAEEATKTFTQEELDAIVSKRLAREQRKWEREQALRREEAPARPAEVFPDDFESVEAYTDALAEKKAIELLERREAEKQQRALVDRYHEQEEAARDKYDDFEQVAYNPELAVSEVMAKAIMASDVAPDILYHLGQNPKIAASISRLDPVLQALEIGRLEKSLGDAPLPRKTSTAPEPIAPVTARANGTPSYDTTDPRSIKTMSTSEWIEADRLRQIKRYEAQRNR